MSVPSSVPYSLITKLDLDSITSSIVYAYLRSSSPSRPTNRHTSDASRIYIPLLNIRRDDVNIRTELLALLPHANIEASQLITLDDLQEGDATDPRDLPLAPESTRWILVDHNALQGSLGRQYSNRVVGCIDHHDEEDKVPRDTGDEPRIIEKCGSCTSLVVNYCRKYWSELSAAAMSSGAANGQDDAAEASEDANVRTTWNAQVAKLALASIVIDTSNLKSEDKTKKVDIDAVEYLSAMLDLDNLKHGTPFDREKFFKGISKAKGDLDGLALRDILRKDYKQWTQKEGKMLGISSVVKPISYLVEKAGSEAKGGSSLPADAFQKSVRDFGRDRDLAVYAMMTTSKSSSGIFQRELLVWVLDPELSFLKDKITKEMTEALGLEEWKETQQLKALASSNKSDEPTIWWQRKVENSRKQVAPLLRKIIG